ncbi:ApeI family dehydratase [Pseudomaricurvus sp.]|uniref:ApeI family dehydratase n=1 Tax=Pseudomaricurvus sp. TaxID=2004510 RepID=UPI003F6B5DA8
MKNFTPLETLFAADHSAELPLFLSPDKNIITWQEWLTRVVQWRHIISQQSGDRWALYHPCAAEFSACLFALLSLNKTVCLPGNRQPDFVTRLSHVVDGFAGDFEKLAPSLIRSDLPLSTDEDLGALSALRDITLNNSTPLIQVFTSGSSGDPQAIGKNLRQLSQEVKHLHMLWGNHRQALVTGTVSHQHIYGLLFRVLWPLAAGWCSDTHPCEYFEELALRHISDQAGLISQAERFNQANYAGQPEPVGQRPRLLISSPTHLSRIPVILDAAVTNGLAAIFSSGAPLMRSDSLHAKTQLGTGVLEIFGSSETGGIAWREQHDKDTDSLWQPLPEVDVRLAADNTETANAQDPDCLEVRSAHLLDDQQWYCTSDRVHFGDERLGNNEHLGNNRHFALLGRADRIVKVEGKRVSLDEMEGLLMQSSWIQQTHLLQLTGSRSELGAVIALTEEGKNALKEHGKRAINMHFKEHLLSCFERPTLPRKWRYIEALPVNTQGKLQRTALLNLFKKTKPETEALISEQKTDLPTTLSTHNASGKQTRELFIPHNLRYFDGHFDQAPILPGVVQIHWAEHFARTAFAPEGEFLRMEVIKFQKVITPGDTVNLDLTYDSAKNKITFAYHSPRGQHSSGRIVLEKQDTTV